MHRVDSSVTLHIDTFQKSANSLVSLVWDRSSEDLVSNFSDAIQGVGDPSVGHFPFGSVSRCTGQVIRGMDALDDLTGYGHTVALSDDLATGPRPPLLYSLTERQLFALDLVAVGLGFVGAIVNLHPPHSGITPAPRGGVEIALLVLACASILFRRRWPIPALAVVTVATSALTTEGRSPLVLIAMLALASYMVANRVPRRLSIPALVGAEAVLGVALGVAAARGVAGDNGLQGLLPVAAAWFVGDSIAARRRYVAGLVEQAEQRRSAEIERSRQSVREERVRIARELHDVVAHSLAVMTVQAGVGRRVMTEHPVEMRAALESIEKTGRTAQHELRLALGLFRDEGAPLAELAPAPGLSDLVGLVEQVRSAGTPVKLSCRGLDHELSPALGLSVFRIIQEALTNVVKHARPRRNRSVGLRPFHRRRRSRGELPPPRP